MVKAKKAGQFLGGIFNNPGVVILGLGIAAIALFRGDIRNAFGSVGESFGQINIELPEFPDVGGAIGGALGGAGEAIGGAVGGAGETIGSFFGDIGESIVGGITGIITPGTGDPIGDDFTDVGQAGARSARGGDGLTPEEQAIVSDPFLPTTEEAGVITVGAIDEFGIGGGPSFEGGTTTFGGGIVDTLTEALAIFPQLTASQARDVLEENPDLTQSQFRLVEPDVLNISNLVEENQTFLPASDPAFTGLTAEQIFQQLVGGNISNF